MASAVSHSSILVRCTPSTVKITGVPHTLLFVATAQRVGLRPDVLPTIALLPILKDFRRPTQNGQPILVRLYSDLPIIVTYFV